MSFFTIIMIFFSLINAYIKMSIYKTKRESRMFFEVEDLKNLSNLELKTNEIIKNEFINNYIIINIIRKCHFLKIIMKLFLI